jgi:DNA-binding PadR family transcriptional regulator
MDYVILGLLMIQPMTYYELNRSFKQGISLFYSASYGSLQTASRKLLGKGHLVFVESVERGRHKKTFHITAAGEKAFLEWMSSEIPESRLETVALTRLYFLGLIGDPAEKVRIADCIVGAIESSLEEMEATRQALDALQIPEEYLPIFRYQKMTADYGIMSHRVALDWFRDVRVKL